MPFFYLDPSSIRLDGETAGQKRVRLQVARLKAVRTMAELLEGTVSIPVHGAESANVTHNSGQARRTKTPAA